MAKKKVDSYYEERYKKWINRIKEEDPLEFEKREIIDAAVYLGYSDNVLRAIIKTTTEKELSIIMCKARKSKSA